MEICNALLFDLFCPLLGFTLHARLESHGYNAEKPFHLSQDTEYYRIHINLKECGVDYRV